MEFIQVNDTTIYYNHFFYEDTVIDGTHGYRVFASVDANGKAVSGSKKEKVLRYINGLNISDAQKDGLYYAFGWAKSTINEAPWH